MKTLKAENIELEANIKPLQQDQALLAQQHQQQQLQQNSGFPTQAQQPQQQAQVVQSIASASVRTIRVNQQQPQVIPLQPQQQQQQPQPKLQQQQQQQQQQQAQPHQQMQQPGAAAGPPRGIQIFQQITTLTGEIYQIPVQLNAEQLQVIRAQMIGGAGSSQNIVNHTAPFQTQLAQPVQTVQTIQLQGGQQMYYIQ